MWTQLECGVKCRTWCLLVPFRSACCAPGLKTVCVVCLDVHYLFLIPSLKEEAITVIASAAQSVEL